MSRNIIIFSIAVTIILGLPFSSVKAQTIEFLEKELSEKKPTPPSPPKTCPLSDFWEDSWDDWSDSYIRYWGISYNYTRQFPISLSLQAHRKLLYCGVELGFATGKLQYESDVSEEIEYQTGKDTFYYERNSYNSIKPVGSLAIHPGLNFNFITLACGLGLCWGQQSSIVADGGGSISYDGHFWGGTMTPNAILHIPVIGTHNLVHLTVNVGYQFMTVFDFDENARKLGSNGNGLRLGAGIEFRFD